MRVQARAGPIGIARAAHGLGPGELEIGERRWELLLGERLAGFDLAHHGLHLTREPALLGVRAQKQRDLGWSGGEREELGHAGGDGVGETHSAYGLGRRRGAL